MKTAIKLSTVLSLSALFICNAASAQYLGVFRNGVDLNPTQLVSDAAGQVFNNDAQSLQLKGSQLVLQPKQPASIALDQRIVPDGNSVFIDEEALQVAPYTIPRYNGNELNGFRLNGYRFNSSHFSTLGIVKATPKLQGSRLVLPE